MKPFHWGPEKNEALRAERGISFEAVVVAIEMGGLVDVLAHPNQDRYPRQRVLGVALDNCGERQYRGEHPTLWSESGRWVRHLFVLRLASLARLKARMSSAMSRSFVH
jgi:hypothetical protein